MRQRILIFAPQFYPRVGGYANATGNLIRALSESDEASVLLVTPEPLGDSAELELDNIQIVRLARYSGKIRYQALIEQVMWQRPLRQLIQGDHWDLVLFESLENPLTQYLVLKVLDKRSKERLVVRIHGTNAMEGFRDSYRAIDRFYWFFVKRVLHNVHNITSTTRQYFRFLEAEVFLNAMPFGKRLGVISNIVWPPDQELVSIEPDEEGVIEMLTLGRMNRSGYHQKNFELIPRAVHLLRGQRKDLAARLRIRVVGDGEMSQRFARVIKEMDVEANFELIPRLPNAEIRAMQSEVHAVLLVSRFEGQSMFALESLAAGAPLVLSRDTGVSDLVAENYSNGALVDPLDALDLADALIRVCDSQIEELRRASIAHYTAYYRPQKVLRDLSEYVEQLSANP
ncbi:MAG: glycosyltransferase family 4 protein [Pseudomonadota bacterium]